MRKVLRISVLVMALAFSVSAGDMQNGVASTPPPPAVVGDMQNGVASAGVIQNGVTGDIQNGVSTSPAESTATEAFLTLLQSLLALL